MLYVTYTSIKKFELLFLKAFKNQAHRSEWPSSKYLETINAGEGVEKREPSCTVGGNVN